MWGHWREPQEVLDTISIATPRTVLYGSCLFMSSPGARSAPEFFYENRPPHGQIHPTISICGQIMRLDFCGQMWSNRTPE